MKFKFGMLVYIIAHYCFKIYSSCYNNTFLMFHFVSISLQPTDPNKVELFLPHQLFLPLLNLFKDFTNMGNSINPTFEN